MHLIICCGEYMKYEQLWDFKKHLTEKHGYSQEAADKRILDFIEELNWWKVA